MILVKTILFTIFVPGTTSIIIPKFILIYSQNFGVYYEEPNLTQKFGKSYADYCKIVPRWFPKKITKTI